MKSPIFLPWLITCVVVLLLLFNVTFAHFYNWQNPLVESERLFWRTVFYILTILMLPLANLLRHIFLRLNQTMPLLANANPKRVAKTRYTLTISVSMLIMLLIGGFSTMIFYFGDSFNTLHILTSVAALGVFLYRPKLHEYQQIQNTITENEND